MQHFLVSYQRVFCGISNYWLLLITETCAQFISNLKWRCSFDDKSISPCQVSQKQNREFTGAKIQLRFFTALENPAFHSTHLIVSNVADSVIKWRKFHFFFVQTEIGFYANENEKKLTHQNCCVCWKLKLQLDSNFIIFLLWTSANRQQHCVRVRVLAGELPCLNQYFEHSEMKMKFSTWNSLFTVQSL